jgi:NADH-quinone oxidoreductase subunit N
VIWFDEPTGEFLPAPTGVAFVTRVTGLATVLLLPFMIALISLVVNAGGAIGG